MQNVPQNETGGPEQHREPVTPAMARTAGWLTPDRVLLAVILAVQVILLYRVFGPQPGSGDRLVAETDTALPPATVQDEEPVAPVQPVRAEPQRRVQTDVDRLFSALFGDSRMTNRAGAFPPPFRHWPRSDELHDRMNRIFEEAMLEFEEMERLFNLDEGWNQLMASPALDMRENEGDYTIVFSLPGLDETQVSVTLEGRLLTILGSHDPRARHSFGSQTFEHRIQLPGPVGQDPRVEAVLTNGILRVRIPKTGRQATATTAR